MTFLSFSETPGLLNRNKINPMKELVIALGLLLFLEGILYALFPSKMKNMLKTIEKLDPNQLRIGGLIFALIGFLIIWYTKN